MTRRYIDWSASLLIALVFLALPGAARAQNVLSIGDFTITPGETGLVVPIDLTSPNPPETPLLKTFGVVTTTTVTVTTSTSLPTTSSTTSTTSTTTTASTTSSTTTTTTTTLATTTSTTVIETTTTTMVETTS